jgi:uncharacterized protein with beta-barrel porin domain
MRRRFMFASALVSLTVFAPAAFAQRDVTTEVTTPIATSTAATDGGPADILISSGGRVVLTSATTPALTIDSDNSIEILGTVSITTDDDDAVGVHVQGGNTGTLDVRGPIQIVSETAREDVDGDGFVDGSVAGSNRVAILVDGVAVFTGDILVTGGGSMTVQGDDSAGIRILTGLDGTLDMGGRIAVTGDRSFGIDLRDDITGGLYVGGNVSVAGEDARGVSVAGDVGAGVIVTGSINSTGYRFLIRPSDEILANAPAEVTAQGGSAFFLNGNVADGLLLQGPTTDALGTPEAVLSQRGSAPAMHILANAASGDIVLGEVVIPAVPDDPDTPEDESQPAQLLGYSFVNRGQIRAAGEVTGIESTALRIEGTDGQMATFSQGILNEGFLISSTFDAVARSVSIGQGAVIPVFQNTGDVLATTVLFNGTAEAMVIESGAVFPSLVNDGTIFANALLGGSSVGVRDESGTLTSLVNSGVISALHADHIDADGVVTPAPFTTVAIDLSAGATDRVVRQYRRDDAPTDWQVGIVGDILFGDGNDELRVEAGDVSGDIFFGNGADRLIVTGGTVSSALSDADGDLEIQVDGATLLLGAETASTIREARFGDGSVLQFQVDHEQGIAANLNATGTVTFEAGSRVSSSLASLIGDGASYVVLTANNLVIEEALATLEQTQAPYLYESALSLDPLNSNSLILTLRRRTADELGMNASQGAAYNAAYSTWEGNADLSAAIASLMNQEDFFSAYDQLLPEYSASAIQFAMASNDSAIGALATRLETVRRSPDDSAGLWVQEFGYFADRAGTAFGPGYRGQGIGIAVGVDRPAGPFYAVGVNFVGAASEVSEVEGVDDPMSSISGQIGGYAGADLGGMNLDVYGGVGFDQFEHNRRVLIGSFDATPTAEWTGYHIAGSARLGKDFQAGRFFFRPSASIDYLHLFESAYTETGGGAGIDLFVDDRDSTSFTGTALLTAGALFERSNSWWAPQIRAGFRSEFADDPVDTMARFDGFTETFTLQSQQIPGTGFIFGFGIGAGSGYSTFSFDYDADVREDFVRHTARLVMRMVF